MVILPSSCSSSPQGSPSRSTLCNILSISLLLSTFSSFASAEKMIPAKRHYDSHVYYVLELDPLQLASTSSPHEIAAALGAEHVEQVGELAHHYLIRAHKELVARGDASFDMETSLLTKRSSTGESSLLESRDVVMERYKLLKRGEGTISNPKAGLLQARDGMSSTLDRRDGAKMIRSLERQHLRKRTKRQLIAPPSSSRRRSVYPRSAAPPPASASNSDVTPAPSALDKLRELFQIQDPIFPQQWHLVNEVIPEFTINVTGLWKDGVHGKGVNVAIVDDGLDVNSDDLKENFYAEGSWDYNDHNPLPLPRLSDDLHGTRCAGEIAAGKNNACGVGVAWSAGISGIRILSDTISDADEAAALNYGFQGNHIYSCSWGPPDDGRSMEAPGRLIVKAMLNGIQKGRGGKGSIFVFASGNGAALDDQCNFDGYTNSLMSITVGAIDRKGLHPFYSEACSANMVVTYSSGSGDNIHTTDVGKNSCTDRHGGTSAAAPIAAGIFALVLGVRPDLTWRDLQHLCVQTAVQVNPDDPDWQMTASGRNFNHKYGFGRLDAWAIVEAARTFKLVKPQSWWESPPSISNLPITSEGTEAKIVVTQKILTAANLEMLEHVTVKVNIQHQRRGNVEVTLVSPNGMISTLARTRRFDDNGDGFSDWMFMTVKHWDENPLGTWTLRVRDQQKNNKNGTFESWSMQLWGSSIDASKAVDWALPEEVEEVNPADPAAAITTALQVTATPVSTKSLVKPTAHLPDNHGEKEGEAHLPFGDPMTPLPTAAPTATAVHASPTHYVDRIPSDVLTDESGYLSAMSSMIKSKTWLFVAGGTIVVFLAAVTFWLHKRRRGGVIRSGAGYDFAPNDEDDLQLGALEGGVGQNRARTMDLYDAFAIQGDDDESDDEMNEKREGKGKVESSKLLSTDPAVPFSDRPDERES